MHNRKVENNKHRPSIDKSIIKTHNRYFLQVETAEIAKRGKWMMEAAKRTSQPQQDLVLDVS